MHAQLTPAAAAPADLDRRAESKESTRPIRALNRGLEVLTELNRLERAAINTLASAVDLPRTTTYRILETLRLAGYVERDAHDDCYRPTIRVRALSGGFDDEALIGHLARPLLRALATDILWPLALATPAGTRMIIRETSEHPSPPAPDPYAPGSRLSLLGSAAGRAYLAHAAPAQRDALLELLSRSALAEDRLARSRAEVERILAETRKQGYGMSRYTRRQSDETSLAIPVCSKEHVLATLMVRFAAGAVPLRTAEEQFLPRLRELAARIDAQLG